MNINYKCVTCGNEFQSSEVEYLCKKCASCSTYGFQKGTLAVECDIKNVYKKNVIIDPHQFLPLPVPARSSFNAGNTPMVIPYRLRKSLGLKNLFFKNDCLNPSGSLKDRASLLVAAQALHYKEKKVVLASTGNAGSAMACAGAACGLEVILLVPETAPMGKIVQAMLYGAKVIPVKGTYDDAFRLSVEYTSKYGGINRNTAYNPLTVEGKKTVALEIYNQLECKAPDIIYIPTGDGVIFAGVCKGFIDLKKSGLIDELPRCVAVQAEGSNAIVKSWSENSEVVLNETKTIADSLSVKSPASGEMAVRYLKLTKGWGITVSDSQISDAQKRLAAEAGLFVEPSAAAALAGMETDLLQMKQNGICPEDNIVVLLTGMGFKDMKAAAKLVNLPSSCAAELDALVDYLNE